ncbi:MAG: hypothetical protein Q8P18_15575 [Pseudomonadota bacterium]|nr:hypothetical protein [Pseudomonadota bacterium]
METVLETLASISDKLSNDQHKAQIKWRRDMLFGLVAARSSVLYRVAEVLQDHERRRDDPDEKRPAAQIHKRLSRNLNSDRYDDEAARTAHLDWASQYTMLDDGEGVIVGVDYTDVSKPYARPGREGGMQYVARCWDGSKGQQGPGYAVVQLEATVPLPGGGRVSLPLRYHLYSSTEPGHLSQNNVFCEQMAEVTPFIGLRAWWVFDRGFDSSEYIDWLDGAHRRWIIRMKISEDGHPRHVGLSTGEREGCGTLARATKCSHRYSHFNADGEETPLRIGGVHVTEARATRTKSSHPKWVPCTRTLVTVRGLGKEPMVLLVGETVSLTKADLMEVVEAYFRRWDCETASRAMGCSRGWGPRIEDVRALKIRGMRRLVDLIAAAYAWLAELRLRYPDLTSQLVRSVAVHGEVPYDPRYRLFRALSRELQGLDGNDRRRFVRRVGRLRRVAPAEDFRDARGATATRVQAAQRIFRRLGKASPAEQRALLARARELLGGALYNE